MANGSTIQDATATPKYSTSTPASAPRPPRQPMDGTVPLRGGSWLRRRATAGSNSSKPSTKNTSPRAARPHQARPTSHNDHSSVASTKAAYTHSAMGCACTSNSATKPSAAPDST